MFSNLIKSLTKTYHKWCKLRMHKHCLDIFAQNDRIIIEITFIRFAFVNHLLNVFKYIKLNCTSVVTNIALLLRLRLNNHRYCCEFGIDVSLQHLKKELFRAKHVKYFPLVNSKAIWLYISPGQKNFDKNSE